MIKKLLIFILLLGVTFFGISRDVKAVDPNSHFFYYETGAIGSPYRIYTSSYFLIESHDYMEILIPKIEYLQAGMEGYESAGVIYNSTIKFSDQYYRTTETTPIKTEMLQYQEENGVFMLPNGLSDLYNPITTPKYFQFTFEIPYYADMEALTTFLNDRFTYVFDGEIIHDGQNLIRYFANGNEYYTVTDYSTPEIIPPNPVTPTMYFAGWFDINGYIYNFDEPLTPDEYGMDEYSLYAGWVTKRPLEDPDVNSTLPDSINHILTTYGWNSTGAKLIIFLVISLLMILGGTALKLPAFTHIMISMLLGGLFIFIQFIPLYVAIPLVMLQIVILIKTLRGGLD